MTASATSSASSGTSLRQGLGGRIGFVVLLVGALVLLAYVAGGSRAGDPLDPDSTQPDGARGLVVLLEELGAEVEVSADVPEPGDGDVALVLLDQLTDQQEDQLVAWTEGGGRLVVADPASDLAPLAQPPDLDSITGLLEPEQCDVGPLEQLDQLEVPFAARYEVGDDEGTRSCYGDGELAFVVSTRQGAGVATSVGGAGGFTNELLDEGDNAPLAVALLAPTPGTSVQIVTAGEGEGGGGAGGGDASTSELVGSRVRLALLQLVVAFVVYAVWRAIRLGKPVGEPQPVQVEGSELVAAVGRLLQQNRSPQAAADLLRRDLRHTLEDRLGVPADLPPDVAVDLVVDRTGLDPRTVAVAVEATHVQDEGDLVEVAHAIDLIRAEVLHGRRT